MANTRQNNDKNARSVSIGGRVPPHAIDAEQAVLCCALLSSDSYLYISERLETRHFYLESHQLIFDAMKAIRAGGANVDLVTLANAFSDLGVIGGMQYLVTISNAVPVADAANLKAYVKIIREKYTLRSIIQACSEAIDGAFLNRDAGELLTKIEGAIYEVGKEQEHGKLEIVGNVAPNVMEELRRLSLEGARRGLSTGYAGLNSCLNGMQPSDLILVAARPSVGKTAFAMNMMTNVAIGDRDAKDQTPRVCAVFSLEMTKEQLTQRMLASVAGVSLEKINKGNLNTEDWSKLAKAQTVLSKTKLFLDDTSMIRPSEIMEKCQRLKMQEKRLDIVMIDYLQLMMGDRDSESRQNEVAEITRFIKIMAKELNVPVLLLSQLSRKVDSRQDKTPILSDLRESGAIEQDADIVMFIHRDKEVDRTSDKADIIVAKHRNGALARIPMKWVGEFTRFMDDDSTGEGAFLASHTPPRGEKHVIMDNEPDFPPLPPQIENVYTTSEEPFEPTETSAPAAEPGGEAGGAAGTDRGTPNPDDFF